MKRFIFVFLSLGLFLMSEKNSDACTGIALPSADGGNVVARTVEWAATPMQCGYVVCPRKHRERSYTPDGADGMVYESKYGYVGIYTEYEPFVVEGVNETGLSAGLFFFPQYGEYAPYKPEDSARTLCDMQFVSWVLSQFSSIDQVKEALKSITLVTLNHKIGSVHWRITQPDGKMAVLEVVGGVPHFYDNELGVLTNSPGFEWHMTNLDNYVNLRPGAASDYDLTSGVELRAIGGGSGMIGLPGDFTPPSRFVRAAFFKATSPVWKTSWEAVQQAFHILNNFDIPIGIQFSEGHAPAGMMSATQFTAATDQKAMRFYYRTAYNSNLRCIDLKSVDFEKVKYQSHPLDDVKEEPVKMLKIG